MKSLVSFIAGVALTAVAAVGVMHFLSDRKGAGEETVAAEQTAAEQSVKPEEAKADAAPASETKPSEAKPTEVKVETQKTADLPKEAITDENLVPEAKRNFVVPFKGAGKMGLVYTPVFFPRGAEGLEISCEVKITDVVKGAQNWFDARIMMDFIDKANKKVNGGPAIGGWKGTKDWFPVKKTVKVANGAAGIALMPCLFNVKSGAMEVRNLSVVARETFVEDPEDRARREAQERRNAANMLKARANAMKTLEKYGSLIPPPKDAGSPYCSLVSTVPGKIVNSYKEYPIPEGVEALRLSWNWKVEKLKTGEKPWFDARMLLKFKGADGKEIKPEPRPTYTQRNTDGFQARTMEFLVPSNAISLVVMPSLFQVKAGEMTITDMKLVPTAASPLVAKAAEEARQIAARRVPDEAPNRAKWPKEIRVVGNRVVDADGKDVWLQGVNAGGMESVPNGEQIEKSTVVAIDEWKANCIRLPINEAHWFGTSPYQNDGGVAFRRSVDKIVTLAANRGAYVALDLHRFRAPKAEHVEFWKDAAKHFANHPAVIFDLFNEPHGIDWKTWRDGGWVGEAGKVDESAFLTEEEKRKNQGFESVGMQALLDAVRSTGARNIVIAGGRQWANDLTGIANEEGKPTWELVEREGGNGIMYAWHTYHWHKGWGTILPVAAKYPIFLGEVGAAPREEMTFIPLEQKEDPYTFSPDMLGFIQKNHIHWTAWCFHPKAGPCMIKSWDYDATPYWGAFAKRALAGEKFEMKRMR